ncbi:MAG: PEP-CTERM sorting domain-containing protein [Microcystaceae cyanobacterium]
MNTTLRTLSTLAVGSVAAATFAGSASAATLNANLAFGLFGGSSPTFTGDDLGSAETVTFGDSTIVNQNPPPTYEPPGGVDAPNDFFTGNVNALAPVPLLTSITISPLTFDLTANDPLVLTFPTAGGDTVTFTSDFFERNSSGPNELDLVFFGDSTSSNGSFDSSSTSVTFAFTQALGSGIVSYSGTIASPPDVTPSNTVPEPGTLLGLGLFGLASLAGRRLKK